MKHTEWKASEPKTNEGFDNQTYFSISVPGTYNYIGFFYPNSTFTPDEQIKTSKLIAAAPELLELAIEQDKYYRKIYEAGVLDYNAHEKWNRIKTTIKKATE